MLETELNLSPDATRNVGYVGENHDALLKHEGTNWWFLKRNDLITWMIGKFGPPSGRYLEIGCGNGCVTKAIKDSFPGLEINATEFLESGIENARQRMPDVNIFQLDARDLDGTDTFDVVGAFDVLEHIDDDEGVIAGISKALKPGGVFCINVPQHDWLWSVHDDYARHVRRYSKKELCEKLEAAQFEIMYSTSFVSLLVPVMWAQRKFIKQPTLENYDVDEQFEIPKVLNSALGVITSIEHLLRKVGISLPFGGSLAVVARKL